MFDNLKRKVTDAGSSFVSTNSYWDSIKKYFSGINTSELKDGWITIPCTVLNTLAKQQLSKENIAQDICLSCEGEMISLVLKTQTDGAPREIKTLFQFTDFTFSEHKQSISVRVQGDVQVDERTTIEQIIGLATESSFKSILNQDWLCSLLMDRQNIPCTVNWPDITFDFSDRLYIKLLRMVTIPIPFLSPPLLCVVNLSSARVIRDSVQIKLSLNFDLLSIGEKK